MNTIGAEVIEGLNKAVDLAESDPKWRGLVISNEGANSLRRQRGHDLHVGRGTGMGRARLRHPPVPKHDHAVALQRHPVVAAPHQLTLGGGCEVCLHVDKVVAHAETYVGLVEFGVGSSRRGGTKEFVLANDQLGDGTSASTPCANGSDHRPGEGGHVCVRGV